MESGWHWEQKTLINELAQGAELAKQLKGHLNMTSSTETREWLLEKILCSYEKALMILNWSGSAGQPMPTVLQPMSPLSINGSPQSEVFESAFKDTQERKDVSKKRKVSEKWTNHVRVSLETGLEGPQEDGYSWRKYGQKDILAAKYPRSYYRCTYRNVQGCLATKQVQRSDDDPSIFSITYRGIHTCIQAIDSSASLENQAQKQTQNAPNDSLSNFRTSLRVNVEDSNNKEMIYPFSFPSTSLGCTSYEDHVFSAPPVMHDSDFLDTLLPPFVSPAASESNYYPASSAATSVTNSPMPDLDFALDPVDFDPSFPFESFDLFP